MILWKLSFSSNLLVNAYFQIIKNNNMKKQSLYTEKVEAGKRSFYFDIRESENGSNYLVISEVSKKEDETTERRQIVIFENEIDRVAVKIGRSLLNFTRKSTSKEAIIARAKERYANAYEPWSEKDDAELTLFHRQGSSIENITKSLQRQPGAIKLRLKKLNLAQAA